MPWEGNSSRKTQFLRRYCIITVILCINPNYGKLTDPTDALKAIRRQDARIIVGLFYVTEVSKYNILLYGND